LRLQSFQRMLHERFAAEQLQPFVDTAHAAAASPCEDEAGDVVSIDHCLAFRELSPIQPRCSTCTWWHRTIVDLSQMP
jgi:hypothetical protein